MIDKSTGFNRKVTVTVRTTPAELAMYAEDLKNLKSICINWNGVQVIFEKEEPTSCLSDICPNCHGVGKLCYNTREGWHDECFKCRGTGKIKMEPIVCPVCKGTGIDPNSTEQDHFPCPRCIKDNMQLLNEQKPAFNHIQCDISNIKEAIEAYNDDPVRHSWERLKIVIEKQEDDVLKTKITEYLDEFDSLGGSSHIDAIRILYKSLKLLVQ
jgi:hypothetical protein